MINWMSATTDNTWQSVIDPNNSLNSWYLKYKSTYGSWKWLRPRIILIGLTLYISLCLPQTIYPALGYNMDGFIYLIIIICTLFAGIFGGIIPLFLYIFMYKNISRLDDKIGLRSEIKISVISLAIIIILCDLLIIYAYFYFTQFNVNLNTYFTVFFIWFSCLRIIMLIS